MNSTMRGGNQPPPANNNGDQPESMPLEDAIQPATRAKKPGNEQPAPHRALILLGGGFVVALLIFVFTSSSNGRRDSRSSRNLEPPHSGNSGDASKTPSVSDRSVVPLTESVGSFSPPKDQSLGETDIERTAAQLPGSREARSAIPGSLGAIPQFSQTNTDDASLNDLPPTETSGRTDHSPADSPPSLVFARRTLPNSDITSHQGEPTFSLGLPPGFRLRARLESAATTAIRVPVLAVVDYNYERNGIVIIPAGTKAVGHIEQADRSGYLSIRFESLLLPNAAPVPIDGIATDTKLQPLRGRVEGKIRGNRYWSDHCLVLAK